MATYIAVEGTIIIHEHNKYRNLVSVTSEYHKQTNQANFGSRL